MKLVLKNTLLLIFTALSIHLLAQKSFLQSGPMVGYSEMREVQLWVQTTESANVQIVYWEKGISSKKYYTLPTVTALDKAFACKLLANKVQPGKIYEYELWINRIKIEFPYSCEFRSQTLWQWRTDAPDFSFVVGSCTYINDPPYDRPKKPYGGDYQIFNSIDSTHPEFMIWLGDNIYLREADWNTKTGIYYRYTHTRSLPEMQSLLAHTHNYAIWDDHDYGPNDADRSFVHKDLTLQAFKDFWPNPSFGINGSPSTITQFRYNDCHFFALDNRYFRESKKNQNPSILGKEQVNWLLEALSASHSHYKFIMVGGQFLNTAKTYENHSNYAEERQYILDEIKRRNIKDVIFLNGDRHHGEISKLSVSENNTVYDITSSPLTATAHKKIKEENDNRVSGSLIKERHFTQISVTGKRKKRIVSVQFFDSNGKSLFQYVLE